MCFAGFGCGLELPPSDRYPIPKEKLPTWVSIVMTLVIVLLICVLFKFLKTPRKKNMYKDHIIKEKQQIDNDLVDVQKIVEEAKKREATLIKQRFELQAKPDTWSTTNDILVEVPATDEQYWDVVDRLRETMDDAHISKLWRIQNNSLWTYYSFHTERLAMNGTSSNEKWVFHGTRGLDPAVIYKDQHDGFMMQFASPGLWGYVNGSVIS